jgi:hypothetical protein
MISTIRGLGRSDLYLKVALARPEFNVQLEVRDLSLPHFSHRVPGLPCEVTQTHCDSIDMACIVNTPPDAVRVMHDVP